MDENNNNPLENNTELKALQKIDETAIELQREV